MPTSAAPKATKPIALRPPRGGAIDVIGGVDVGRPQCMHAIAAFGTGWPQSGHVAGVMASMRHHGPRSVNRCDAAPRGREAGVSDVSSDPSSSLAGMPAKMTLVRGSSTPPEAPNVGVAVGGSSGVDPRRASRR